ncbi:putative ribonuclease H-like domain-containing protein [Tanacetum coccineum]
MNQFCRMEGIKREFSVARTPQQNGVAERKNMTLIEEARTMLADSLLPTIFWTEAVSTACYVQNKVLVTKPHNKTPYELLHGIPPSISFMRPFGCPVTILNTLDPLGKFNEKADEGYFIGYFINSKVFRVFNTKTRKVEENLNITFLENKPNVAGSGPDFLFDIDLLTNSMNYKPVTVGNQTNKNAGIKDNADVVPTQQYILLPLLYDSPQSSKDAVADDAGKKTNEEPANEGERNGQEKEGGASNKEDDQNVQDFRVALDNLLVQQKKGYANSTNRDSTVSPSVSTVGQSFTNADDLPTDPLMPDLEDTADLLNTGIFSGAYDDEDVGAEADLNNLETTMNVSPIPTTRIHKDHPKDHLADEGFFVGYSINSKAFRVFNTRTRKVEENLHITFLENKPNVAGSGPDWLFDIDLLTNSMNYEPVTAGNQTNKNACIKDNVDAVPTQQYILLPLLYDSPQSSKDAVAADANEEPSHEGERNDLPTDPLIPNLEDTGIFSGAYDNEDMGAEADLNNLEITMNLLKQRG